LTLDLGTPDSRYHSFAITDRCPNPGAATPGFGDLVMAVRNDWRQNTKQSRQPSDLADAAINLAAVSEIIPEAVVDVYPSARNGLAPTSDANHPRIWQVVFIDGSVPDAQLLADGTTPGVFAIVLDPHRDGVKQIAAYLAAHRVDSLAAIDIVAHGQDGTISLGSAVLSARTLAQYRAELATIGSALQAGGAVQIFGCDVAQDAAGVAFLDQLSVATNGAKIAASSHLVGAADGGGSWTLDVSVGNVDVANPFTAATVAAYPTELVKTTNQVFASFFDVPGNSLTRIEQLGVTAGGGLVPGSTVDISDGSQVSGFNVFYGLAVDAPAGKYYQVVNDQNTVNEILAGTIGGGTPAVLYSQSDVSNFSFTGLALDQTAGELYFAQATDGQTPDGIYRIGVNGGAPQPVVTGTPSQITSPLNIALDLQDGLVFFTDSLGVGNGVNNLDVGFSGAPGTNGALQVLNSQLSGAIQSELAGNAALSGVAVDPKTETLYFTLVNGGSATDNFIERVPYTVSAGHVTLGAITTLYSGAGAGVPTNITIDAQDGIFYTTDGGSQSIKVGSVTHTGAGSLTTAYQLTPTAGIEPNGIVFLSTPTVTAGGTMTDVVGGSAVILNPIATVTNSDGQGLANATVQVSGGSLSADGDTLAAATAGTSITGIYTPGTETLTLSGADTVANYQSVLRSVKLSSTGVTLGSRAINWTVSDGITTSATPTSTVTVHAKPAVTAGSTATFTGGGAAVILDSGLTLGDQSSSTLTSATVLINGFVSGDFLTVGATGGLTTSFLNGTLALSGTASLATYQTALNSVAYSFSPSNGDPTGGGTHTSRSISWSVNDGTASSASVSSTLNTVHVPGTVLTAGDATYTGAAVVVGAGLTVSDIDSAGTIAGATATINNFQAGDTLQFNNQLGITGRYASGTGVLTLSGSAALASYQTALDSVTFATTSIVQSVRTIAWAFNDGAGSSNVSTSSVNVLCFCSGTLIDTPLGEVQVEKLSVGNLVLTAHNGPRKVTWVGVGKVLATRGKRTAATPVIVRKGALGENLPHQDLRLTKAHGLYLEGVLIPVEFLVNHRTILWDDRAQEVELYHVELESHDLLLANGAPAESYRDDGNRWLFQNASSGWGLAPQKPYAPVVTGGPVVDAVWQRLLDRAGPRSLPPMTDDPDLHLMVDNQRLDAAESLEMCVLHREKWCRRNWELGATRGHWA
jgi:hypothetical protein